MAPEPPAEFYSREFLVKHINDILAFYEHRIVDEGGGYRQNFYIDGTEFNPGFQQIVSSARMVINFMLAGKLLGRAELLDIGRHGLEYLEKGHWVPDKEMYAFTMRDHKPEDMTQQAYGYAFVLAAHAAARLAGASADDAAIAKVFDLMERRFWLPEKGAYADTLSADGVLSEYRGQNSNMHICEALIAAYEATGDERYLRRAEVLAETFTQRLAGRARGLIWEHYTPDFEIDWEYNRDDPKNLYRPWGFQPGHQIEWTKNLLNICRYAPQDWMLKRARELFDTAYDTSWDHEHGGLVYGFGPDMKWCDDDKCQRWSVALGRSAAICVHYGSPWCGPRGQLDAKRVRAPYFWVQAESIAAAALLHQATGDAKYRDRYNALWRYSWEQFVDHEHGAWFGLKLTRNGQKYSNEKAFAGGKCDYHTLVSCVEALRVFK